MHNQNVQLQNHLRSEMDLMIAQHYLVNVVEGGSECVHVWGQAEILHVCGRGHRVGLQGGWGWMDVR